MTALPIKSPQQNQLSQGPVGFKYALIDPANDVWLLTANGALANGEGAGWTGKGSIALDYTTGRPYLQTGTLAAPVWSPAGLNFLGFAASGISTGRRLFMLAARNLDGSVIDATGGAGKFAVSVTLGTSMQMLGENANTNTKTDDAIMEYQLSDGYIAAANITVTVNAKTSGAGTLTTKTIGARAYKQAADGTQGANLIATAAQAMTGAAADYLFTVTGTTLNPGDVLVLEVETIMTETGGTNTRAVIGSVRIG